MDYSLEILTGFTYPSEISHLSGWPCSVFRQCNNKYEKWNLVTPTMYLNYLVGSHQNVIFNEVLLSDSPFITIIPKQDTWNLRDKLTNTLQSNYLKLPTRTQISSGWTKLFVNDLPVSEYLSITFFTREHLCVMYSASFYAALQL